jgi:hypothetical protein
MSSIRYLDVKDWCGPGLRRSGKHRNEFKSSKDNVSRSRDTKPTDGPSKMSSTSADRGVRTASGAHVTATSARDEAPTESGRSCLQRHGKLQLHGSKGKRAAQGPCSIVARTVSPVPGLAVSSSVALSFPCPLYIFWLLRGESATRNAVRVFGALTDKIAIQACVQFSRTNEQTI